MILATGGFSGNPDMLREYNTMWPFEEDSYIPTTNCYGHTGDGITMGLAVGGTVALMDTPMPFPMADCKNSTDETTVGDDVDCMIVNKEGERFMNEVLDRYTMTENIMAQTDQMMYMITDADTCRVEGDKNRYGHSLQSLVDQGQLFIADSIEELAEKIGCDPATLSATVERYNEAAVSGEDPDFGRTTFSENSPIVNPPFYASPRTWAMHITVGGLVVDACMTATRCSDKFGPAQLPACAPLARRSWAAAAASASRARAWLWRRACLARQPRSARDGYLSGLLGVARSHDVGR